MAEDLGNVQAEDLHDHLLKTASAATKSAPKMSSSGAEKNPPRVAASAGYLHLPRATCPHPISPAATGTGPAELRVPV